MPPVVTGAIWLYLLSPTVGPVFQLLVDLGLLENAVYWSTQGDMAMAVIMGVLAWTFWPFMFLIILASLENIPEEYYETARVYGANRIQQFVRITLPQLKSAILVAVSIRVVWNLTKISQPLQMTGGGPGYQTSILAVLVYRFGWLQGRLGLAFATGVILLLVTLGFIIIFIREFQRSTEEVGA
jgi:ABC-type sugar transport system permease subunit